MRVVKDSAFRICEDEPRVFKASHDEFKKDWFNHKTNLEKEKIIKN
jgi:hypothetical protein